MKAIALLLLSMFAPMAIAEVSDEGKREIEHLLNFVKHSPCQIERNGKIYNAPKAVSHMQKKYAYFEDEIASAEDFIEYSATRSTMSGKDYQVHCEGEDSMRSQDWLLQELARLRQTAEG